MRNDEKFAGNCLVDFLGGRQAVSVVAGEDPPDLYLNKDNLSFGVEVTQLWDHTFKSDGTLGNRATQNSFGVQLINQLDVEVGPSLPRDLSLLVDLHLPVAKPSRFRKTISDWIAAIAANATIGAKDERIVEGSRVGVAVIPRPQSGKGIVGVIASENTSADIGLNAKIALRKAIITKHKICAPLRKPIWLALLNAYWLADSKTYELAWRELNIRHCFERVFLITDDGVVHELTSST